MPPPDSRSSDTAPPDYQSLYRRFRPQRFDEVLGQEHVSLALRNAVRHDKVAHAYLFSGPRGTGKTSTARILAKALNCEKPEDGEPCGHCPPCVEITRGTSLDVHELDAASNNGVDAMRDLVARAALGTPGRWKVYIVDEVHMLSTQASNALLKTLEEPPGHVVFVLATTEPQKVLPTVRSRTQHFEFRLLGPDVLAALVRQVRDNAGLDLGDDAVDAAVRRGRGSARDALSALDQLAAAGVVEDEVPVLADLGDALAARDAAAALVAVARAAADGRDVHSLAGALVEHLRQGFLSMVAPELVTVSAEDRLRVEEMARRLGLPAVVRAMEVLGKALVDMRDSPDPRVTLEAALIRLAHPEADDSPAALLERVERLERATGDSGAVRPADPPGPGPQESADRSRGGEDPSPTGAAGPDLARQSLGALRKSAGRSARRPAPAADQPPPPPSPPAPGRPSSEGSPTRDELVEAWGDRLLTQLSNRARARFRVGRFLAVEDGTAVFALPNETHRSYCEEVRLEVEQALAGHFGSPVAMRLVVDDEGDAATARRSGAPTAASVQENTGLRSTGVTLSTAQGSGAARSDPASPASASATATASSAPAMGADEHSALLDPAVLAAETEPAGTGPTPEQRLKQMFPGAEEL